MRLRRTLMISLVSMLVLSAIYPIAGYHWDDSRTTSLTIEGTRVAKPTSWGSFPRGYRDYNVSIPSRVSEGLNENVTARVFYPATSNGSGVANDDSGAPYPTLLYIPGGSSSHTYVDYNAEMISSYGFVVVNVEIVEAPGSDLSTLRDMTTLCGDVTVVLDWITAKNSSAVFELKGMMDVDRLGITGHSWGGVTAMYASTNEYGDQRLKASHPVSPEYPDNFPQADVDIEELSTVDIPFQLVTEHTYAYPNPYYARVQVPKTCIFISGATHSTIKNYEEYQISFFRYWFYGDTDYETFIYGEEVRNEMVSGKVPYYEFDLSESNPFLSETDIMEDQEIILTGNVSGLLLNATVIYEWDFNGDGSYEWSSQGTNSIKHTYTQEGTYAPTFKYWDVYEGDTIQLNLEVVNVMPTADAGEDVSSYEDQTIHLDGSGSTDTPSDISLLQYQWDFGDTWTTSWSSSTLAEHFYTNEGTYGVTLTVMDDNDDLNTSSIEITINNIAPVASFDSDISNSKEDESVQFDASGSFDTASDNDSLEYEWDFGDGKTGEGKTVKHAFKARGEYVVNLTVTDDNADKGWMEKTITVNNVAPIVLDAGEAVQALEDEQISFTGSAIDTTSDAPSLTYQFDFGDGEATDWSGKPTAGHLYPDQGEYEAFFRVKDNDDAISERLIPVKITNVEPTVEASASKTSIKEAEVVSFTCISTDSQSDVDGLVFLWDFSDGTRSVLKETEHSFNISGTHKVKLTVKDDDGAEAESFVTITVQNVDPTARITADKTKIKAGGTVVFDGSLSSDTQNDLPGLTYTWLFGEGENADGVKAEHTFITPGEYEVTLVVSDDDGARGSVSVLIMVEAKVVEPDDDVIPDNGNNTDGNRTSEGESQGSLATVAVVIILVLLIVVGVAVVAIVLVMKRKGDSPDAKDEEEEAVGPDTNNETKQTPTSPEIKTIDPGMDDDLKT